MSNQNNPDQEQRLLSPDNQANNSARGQAIDNGVSFNIYSTPVANPELLTQGMAGPQANTNSEIRRPEIIEEEVGSISNFSDIDIAEKSPEVNASQDAKIEEEKKETQEDKPEENK